MVTACGQALSSLPTYTLSLILSVIELYKTQHQCGVCIGLYTLSSRRGLHMGCRIVKGVSKRCVSRLLLTIVYIHRSCLLTMQNVFGRLHPNGFCIVSGHDLYLFNCILVHFYYVSTLYIF